MTLAGHASFKTTHRFYLAVADDLMHRAREATVQEVSPDLLEKCCRRSLENGDRGSESGARWCNDDFRGFKKKADKHNCLPALTLCNEADETRTHNLRIDSPML